MTRVDIYNLINAVIPTHYIKAPIGTALPFATLQTDHDNNFGADDKVYREVTGAKVVLYLSANDFAYETALNTALDNANIYWVSSTDYDDSQDVYTIVYEMEVI